MGLLDIRLTGRTRTLRWAGTLAYPYFRADDTSFLFNPSNHDRAINSQFDHFLGPYGIRIKGYAGHIGQSIEDGVAGHYKLEITSVALGLAISESVELWPAFPSAIYGGTISGSYEVEIDVAEERDIHGLVDPEEPWWNIEDGPSVIVDFREKLRGAGNVRINVTFGAITYSGSFDRDNDESIGSGIGGYYASLSSAVSSREQGGLIVAETVAEETNLWKNRANSTTKEGTIPYKFGTGIGEAISQVPYEQEVSTANGCMASHTFAGGYVRDTLFTQTQFSTGCFVEQWVPIITEIHGRVMCFEEDCPDTRVFDLVRTPAGGGDTLSVPPGGASKAIQQINGRFIGEAASVPASPVYGLGTVSAYSNTAFPYDDDGEPSHEFEVRLREEAFVANTDEVNDPRVMGRGPVFGLLTITHDDEEVLETFSGASGWTPSNSTLGGVTTLTIETADLAGGASKVFAPPVSTEAWRYWVIRFRSVGEDNVNFRLRVNEKKSFYMQTGLDGDFQEVTIDTCAPGSVEGGVPLHQDSRWPVVSLATNRPVNEAKNWGINAISKLEILDLAAGQQIEIDEIKAITSDEPRLQFISAHWNSKVQWYSLAPAASPDRKRHGLFLVDGRTGHELPDGQGIGLGSLAISAYVSEINAVPGWNASLLGFGDSYFNDSLPAQFIAGEGGIWNQAGFATYTDKPMSGGSLEIPCQFLYDRLSVYPGIGNVWEDEDYDDPEAVIHLRYLKFMRGAGHGFALNGSGRPTAGESITIYRSTEGDARGAGVSDAGGFFTTLGPYAYGNRSYDFKSTAKTLGTATIYTRKRQRLSGRVVDAIGGRIAYDVSHSLRHYRAFINDAGEVVTSYSDNRIDWTDQESGISAEGLALRVERQKKNPLLFLWIRTEDGSIIRYASSTEGASYDMPTTIATGEITGHAAVLGENGHQYVYWLEGDPAAVKGKIYDSAGELLEDSFTAIEDVDSDGISVDESVESQGRHRIVLLVKQGGTLKSFKSFNGIDNWI